MTESEFKHELLNYLKRQLDLEEADIESHSHLSRQEKIDEGLLVPDAVVNGHHHDIYTLTTVDDNSKLRIGDNVSISFAGKVIAQAQIVDLGLDEIVLSTKASLLSASQYDIEIIEGTFLAPTIDLMQKIIAGTRTGDSFIAILEGIKVPISQSFSTVPSPSWSLLATNFNPVQQQVINEACLRPNVYCIQGPPGTGKTAVLSQIAYQFASIGKEVLILATTHHAVNNALNKVAKIAKNFNVVKIGTANTISHLHHSVSQYSSYSKYIGCKKTSRRNRIADVIGMTLHKSVVECGLKNGGKPYVILVDEAGQIPMAYASILGSYGCGSIIFIGDDKQMPPIFHPQLIEHPFSTSIFSYMCNKYPELRKTLDITYRMNDEITDLVSKTFYEPNGSVKITASPSLALRRANFIELDEVSDQDVVRALASNQSVVMLNVTPSGFLYTDSNDHEAKFMKHVYDVFSAKGVAPEDYAIITPYRRQVKLIRSLIGNHRAPLINTVECLQGQDVETILISLVSTDPVYLRDQLDFILNPNRLNVMISRAKTKVIILISELLAHSLFERYPILQDYFLDT